MKATCQNPTCGREFTPKRNARGKYCCLACARLANAKRPEVQQRNSQSRLTTPKTGHKVEIVCDGCGHKFMNYLSQRPKPLKFCCCECGFEYRRKQKSVTETADIENDIPLQPTEPKYLVVYDPIKKELRNAGDV